MPSFIEHLSHTTRSYRRFRSIYRVPEGHMKKWVDNTRWAPPAPRTCSLCAIALLPDREMCAAARDTLYGLATLPIGRVLKKRSAQLVTS